jgi:uncharacterized protein (DUF2141 family)
MFSSEIEKVKDQDNAKNGIELIINNIRNTKGLIQIGVFNSENGYPETFSLAKDTISSGQLRFFIPLHQPCSFAITILDDENENGKMDRIFIIKPKEGFGFSNNPKIPGRKAPPFNETVIKYSGGRLEVIINMKYI